MKLKAFGRIFRSKLFIIKPCTKLNKPAVLIRSLSPCLRLHHRYRHKLFFFNNPSSKPMFSPSPSFFSVFRSPKRSSPSPKHTKNDKLERDDHHSGPSIDVPEVEAVVFPSSPLIITTVSDPAGYNNSNNGRESYDRGDGDGDGDDVEVEEACRRFEKHLVEMIVEEGKTKDLKDVEELLCCWKKLKCPVFVDLVCRFYGELCKDLFPSQPIHDTS